MFCAEERCVSNFGLVQSGYSTELFVDSRFLAACFSGWLPNRTLMVGIVWMAQEPPYPPADQETVSTELSPAGEDAQLLRAARDGSEEALGQLIDSWRTYLLHLVEKRMPAELRRKVAVSDLVQSACLDVHQRFGDFRGQTVDEWRVWLRRLVLRDLRDARRRFVGTQRCDLRRERQLLGNRGLQFDLQDDHCSPRATLIAREESAALRVALQQLSTDYRTVLRLRNWECLPFAEIGQRMDRTEEAVRKLWARAIVQLQQLLRDTELD